MHTDYKLFTRIIANRLRPWLAGILQPRQHCGLPGNTVFDAVATVRDAVACAEAAGISLCVLTIDFKEAFDKISHSYLCALLRQYGFSDRFQQRIRNMCDNATASIQIKGHRSSPIPIRSSVRQGCPISKQLFAVCLNPLLCTLENNLTGIQIGRRRIKTTVVAYADDVTIFVTSPTDIPKIQEALHCFEEASGAKVNIGKSRALAIGPWDTSVQIMDIPYRTEAKILAFHITS